MVEREGKRESQREKRGICDFVNSGADRERGVSRAGYKAAKVAKRVVAVAKSLA